MSMRVDHIAPTTNTTTNAPIVANKQKGEKPSIKSVVGSLAGTAIPLAIMMKKRKIKNPLKMNYGLQDMLILSGTSVAGGVLGGIAGEKDAKVRKSKVKEGVFRFMNASVPTWIVGGALKLPESSKKFNNVPTKIFSVIGGLVVGMFGAAQVSNLIFDPKDKDPDRKLTLKDCIANADDAIGALTLAKFPLMDKLHIDKALPLIYAYCGMRAGSAQDEPKEHHSKLLSTVG